VATFLIDIEAMVDRMVPWLPTSAMASYLNMGEKVRRNSVSKTEFRLFPSRTVLVKLKIWELVIVFNKTFWSATNLRLRYASAKCGR
jgi:hypothetical protein